MPKARDVPEIGHAGFGVACQGSVPQIIACFLETPRPEDAVRAAILLRGGAGIQEPIAGSIAETLGGVPEERNAEASRRLDGFLRGCRGRWPAWLGEGQTGKRGAGPPPHERRRARRAQKPCGRDKERKLESDAEKLG